MEISNPPLTLRASPVKFGNGNTSWTNIGSVENVKRSGSIECNGHRIESTVNDATDCFYLAGVIDLDPAAVEHTTAECCVKMRTSGCIVDRRPRLRQHGLRCGQRLRSAASCEHRNCYAKANCGTAQA